MARYAKAGRARSAVEVLVAAPDREVDPPRVELRRHDAGGVAEVPQHERAGLVHSGGDLFDVGEVAGTIGDVAEHDERGLAR